VNKRGPWTVFRGLLLFFILSVHGARITAVYGQGLLPPKASTSTNTNETQGPLIIGEKVPDALYVFDDNGKKRTLLSHKSALELLAVGFFSTACPEEQAKWIQVKHLSDDFTEWRVSFLAINAGPSGSLAELAKRMEKAGLHFPVVEQEAHSLTNVFKISSVPMLVIIDESGELRYRGPFDKDARKAFEAVIGHMEPVPNAEPAAAGTCQLL